MDVTLSGVSSGVALGAHRNANDPRTVHEAACQFESLMIAEMLKTARETTGDGALDGDDADSSGGVAMDMAQEFFAQAVAGKGGLGLAKTIEQGLTTQATRVTSAAQNVSANEHGAGSVSP